MTSIDRHIAKGAVNCGGRFGKRTHIVYELIGRLEPGLCIDVGAAIGETVGQILTFRPGSRVIAYEPFAGNLPHLERAVGGRPEVTLRPVAVADRAGTERLVVPGIVKGDETARSKGVRGYSPLGHLGGRDDEGLPVDVVALDSEVREHVRFLKIDVQGGELRVLRGAARLMEEFGIDVLSVEFNGSYAVLKFLQSRGYVLFDGAYLAWPTRRYFRNWFRTKPDRLVPTWQVTDQGRTPLGIRMAHLWPRVPVRSFRLYCAWFFLNRLFRSGLQTDLVCVHEDFLPQLWEALERN